jgi:hypothetical protein
LPFKLRYMLTHSMKKRVRQWHREVSPQAPQNFNKF